MTNEENEKINDKHYEQSQAQANTNTTDKHRGSQGVGKEVQKVQTVSESKPEVGDLEVNN